ncbi:MAG: SRPBCC family protein [Gemmatimonadetes bacterium]|nr:SRPBCC family protein [Gemmatimonadota bacterium]
MTVMRQRDAGVIRRPPGEVWPWITEPERIARWNPKLERAGAPSSGRLQVGSSWGARYRMGRRAVEVQAVVETWEPPREFTLRYRWGAEAYALEHCLLEPVADGTRLTRVVEIRDPRIPLPFRLLAGFLMRFGRPPGAADGDSRPGESSVDTIRRLVEGGPTRTSRRAPRS